MAPSAVISSQSRFNPQLRLAIRRALRTQISEGGNMTRRSTLTLTIVALLYPTVDGALAAKTYNSSHSNTVLTTPAAEKACTDAGGKVSTRKNGQKVCSINYNASKSNTGN
jgi:hypothetical protein